MQMISREHEWIWDSWYVVEDETLHAFYLMAPKSLGNPDLRHINARVGHSISKDGYSWTHLPEALGPSHAETFDNQAIWTGSIVKENNTWHMFYTGINTSTKERRQALGHAVSDDLTTWKRVSDSPILSAAAPYALLGNDRDGAEHFRDPWVFFHEGSWHMLITASDKDGWGTVAHATSPDLETWQLKEPLISESQFRQCEVTETIQIDGEWFLFFCMGPRDVERPGIAQGFGTYCVPAAGPLGPFDLDRTTLIADEIYAARVVEFRGEWLLLGFGDTGNAGGFTGVICDPIKLERSSERLIRRVG